MNALILSREFGMETFAKSLQKGSRSSSILQQGCKSFFTALKINLLLTSK